MSVTARSVLSSALVGESPYIVAERVLEKLDAAGWEIVRKPRIPEPGQFGVVEAGGDHSPGRHKWVRQGDLWWNGAAWTTWETLTDPVLVREGVDDE